MTLIWVADVLRVGASALFAASVALQGVIVLIAWRVLRPAQNLGFLWWHILAVALSTSGMSFIALTASWGRFGEHISWRLPPTMLFLALHLVALVIIYRVERARLVQKKLVG